MFTFRIQLDIPKPQMMDWPSVTDYGRWQSEVKAAVTAKLFPLFDDGTYHFRGDWYEGVAVEGAARAGILRLTEAISELAKLGIRVRATEESVRLGKSEARLANGQVVTGWVYSENLHVAMEAFLEVTALRTLESLLKSAT